MATRFSTYERVPFLDDEADDVSTPALEKPHLSAHHHVIAVAVADGLTPRRLWQTLSSAPKGAVVCAVVTTLALVSVTLSSFTLHTPGSYVQVVDIHQGNAPRPDFRDAWNGPIEIAGSYRCGTHPSEARSLNCTFDIMNYGFLGAECYYEDMAREALAEGPWTWYLDRTATVEIPQDEYYLGRAVEVVVHWSYHVSHCKYAFAQLRRAAEDDDFLIPQELASEGHTRHCEKVLADPDGKADNILPPYESSTCVRSVYNPCIRLSEANGTWLKVPLERDFLF